MTSTLRQASLTIGLLSCSLAFTNPKAHSQATGNPADIDQIRQLQQRYVTSIDEADPAALDQIWSHAPEVLFIEPLGTERGLTQIKAFVRDTFGKLFSQRDLQLENPAIHVYGDTAWADMTWTFHATLRNGNKPLVTQGRESQIYRREDGAWHIVAVHYSGLPLGKPQGF